MFDFINDIMEETSLALHDGLQSVASWFEVDPQVTKAHKAGGAKVKKAKEKLHVTKVDVSVSRKTLKAVHAEERKALYAKQGAEVEAFEDKAAAQIQMAREAVAQAKATARQGVADARRQLQLARLSLPAEA